MAMKSICKTCKHGHGYYKKKLKRNEMRCCLFGTKTTNKRNCPDYQPNQANREEQTE